MIFDSDQTVSITEKFSKSAEMAKFELSHMQKLSEMVKISPIRSEVTMEKIKNFICPACKETLTEVVFINGKIRGWCGIKGIFVNTIIKEEKDIEAN